MHMRQGLSPRIATGQPMGKRWRVGERQKNERERSYRRRLMELISEWKDRGQKIDVYVAVGVAANKSVVTSHLDNASISRSQKHR